MSEHDTPDTGAARDTTILSMNRRQLLSQIKRVGLATLVVAAAPILGIDNSARAEDPNCGTALEGGGGVRAEDAGCGTNVPPVDKDNRCNLGGPVYTYEDADCQQSMLGGVEDENCGQVYNSKGEVDPDHHCNLQLSAGQEYTSDADCGLAAATSISPDNNCGSQGGQQTQGVADDDCGRAQHANDPVSADNMCANPLSGGGYASDGSCGTSDQNSNAHADISCGTSRSGGITTHEDQDCGKVAGGGGASHADADCQTAKFSGTVQPDNDCGMSTGTGIQSDGNCGKSSLPGGSTTEQADQACGKGLGGPTGVATADSDCGKANGGPGGEVHSDNDCGKTKDAGGSLWPDDDCGKPGPDAIPYENNYDPEEPNPTDPPKATGGVSPPPKGPK